MAQPTVSKFKIANPTLDGNDATFVSSDTAAAATTLPVLSTNGFVITGTSDYYILVGNYGEEKAEIKLVDANGANTDADSFTVAALSFSHSASDPVTFIDYNQVKIYGRTTSGGANNLIATIDIDPSRQYTDYTYEGDTYSYFITSYYNSTGDKESAFSEEITSTTFSQISAKKVIESGLRKAMTKIDENQNSTLSWDIAIDVLNDGLDEIMSRKRKWSFLHTISSLTSTVGGTAYIAKPDDLSILEHLIINSYTLAWMTRYKYDSYTHNGTTSSTGNPTHYTTKNNKYYLYPVPSGAYAIIYEYYKYPTRITDLSQALDREFITILMYYCAAQFSYIRGNDKRGDKMMVFFQNALERQVEEFTGPDQLGDGEPIEQTNINFMEEE